MVTLIMKTKILFSLILVLVVISACNKKEEFIYPTKENITESIYASGNIKSLNQHQIFATTIGNIKKIYVKEGDKVNIGDTLLIIENDKQEINRNIAKLNLENSSIESNKNKLDELNYIYEQTKIKFSNDSMLFQRQKNLREKEANSKFEYEQSELNFKNSKINSETALLRLNDYKRQVKFNTAQSLNSLKLNNNLVGDNVIISSVNGTIYNISKKVGELVNQQAALITIGDSQDFYIELQIDEYDISRIQLDQRVFLGLDSYKNQVFEGKVSRVLPYMNERTKSFTVEVLFTTKPQTLYPNLTVEANILIQKKENILTLPRNYLINDEFVKTENDEKIKVKTGIKDLEKIEILSGVSEKTKIYK
jgi:multidrug efflux pump subunit AcrA (membrane-fusion protein)